MPKAKSSDVKKRRVIIATILKKGEDTRTVSILEKLKEYNINTTRQTVISDKNYLSKQDLNQYIRSETGLLLEIDRDAVDGEIEVNTTLRKNTDDVNVKTKLGSLLRRLYVDRTKIDEKIDALRMKKLEIERPVYNVVIGTQKEVNAALYKKKGNEK